MAVLIVLLSPWLLVTIQKREQSQPWRIDHLLLGFPSSSFFFVVGTKDPGFFSVPELMQLPELAFDLFCEWKLPKKLRGKRGGILPTQRRMFLVLMSIHLIIC